MYTSIGTTRIGSKSENAFAQSATLIEIIISFGFKNNKNYLMVVASVSVRLNFFGEDTAGGGGVCGGGGADGPLVLPLLVDNFPPTLCGSLYL